MSLAAYRYEMARLSTTGLNYVELLDDEIASKVSTTRSRRCVIYAASMPVKPSR